MAFGDVVRTYSHSQYWWGVGGTASKIWISEYSASKIGEISTTDLSIVRFGSPGPWGAPSGVGGTASVIWNSSNSVDIVGERSTSDFSVVRSAASPAGYASGTGGSDNTIWHADSNEDKVYELSTTDFSVVRQASSPSARPYGIGGQDDKIWHCDDNLFRVYELSTTDFSVVQFADAPVSSCEGIGGDDVTVWFTEYFGDIWELEGAIAAAAPTAPTGLLCNGQTNPTDVLPTYFSAIYNDPNAGDIANYYRIQVNKESDFSGRMMWDSDKTAMANVTEGQRCANVIYNGQAVSLNKITYYWRIKFWDDEDQEGVWSAVATFALAGSGAGEMGAGPWGEDILYAISTAPWNGAFGRADVEIPRRSGEWTALGDIIRIHTTVNKNPSDATQVAQAALLCSNIDRDFNSFEEAGAWYKQLEGFSLRITLGCMVSGSPVTRKLFTGIISLVEPDRIKQTAAIKVVDFLDYFGRVTIKETPIWENISRTQLYKNLVELAFSDWVEGVDYFVEDLGGSTIPAIGYEKLNLLSELRKLAECSGMRIFTDINGKLVCRSRTLEGEPWNIKHDYNLTRRVVKEKRDINSVINWVEVHARPHELVYEPTIETPETVEPWVPVLGPDITPPGKISGFTATPFDHGYTLTWNNPIDPDFELVRILVNSSATGGAHYPGGPEDKIPSYEGTDETFTRGGIANGQRLFFSAFTKDITGNWSDAAHASCIVGAGGDTWADSTETSPISAFRAEPANQKIILSWRNPSVANFSLVMIRSSAISYPTGPDKKNKVYEGTAETCIHTGLTNGTRYYYSAFSKNTAGYWSNAQFASAIPAGLRKSLGTRLISGGGCLASQEGIPRDVAAYYGCFFAGTSGFRKSELCYSVGGRSEGYLRFRHKWEVKVTLPYFKVRREIGLNDDLSLSFTTNLGGLATVSVTKISSTRSGLRVEYRLTYSGPRGIRWDFRNELSLRG